MEEENVLLFKANLLYTYILTKSIPPSILSPENCICVSSYILYKIYTGGRMGRNITQHSLQMTVFWYNHLRSDNYSNLRPKGVIIFLLINYKEYFHYIGKDQTTK